MYSPNKATQNTNFINVETKNPMNDPVAAFKARLESFWSKINSPIKAPANGPMINPKGIGVRIPTIKPIFVPQIPYLLPPKRLVP